MRTFSRCSLVATVLTLVLPNLAQAHPGHDGGDVTWDFTHLAAHPFATMGWLVAIGGAAWIVARVTAPRMERAAAVKSVDDRSSDQS